MRHIGLLFTFTISSPCWAFLLINPSYRLANATNVKVYLSAATCSSYGVSTSDVAQSLRDSINNYWNTVPESRLHLEYKGETEKHYTQVAGGEILVGCSPSVTAGIAGFAVPDFSQQGAYIVLSTQSFQPGNYYYDGLVGTVGHEMGHAIGLDHSAESASIMTYEAHGWGAKPTYLSRDDKDGVIYLYPNEAVLGGLLGSCSLVQAESIGGKPVRMSPWAAIFELFVLLGIGRGLRWLGRLLKN
ncbi:MAG: matrixin family metalloprotease [Bdellovibrionales bacterium]